MLGTSVNVNTTAQSRLCDPCGVGPGCRLPPVFLNRNRTERSDRSTALYRYSTCTVPVARVAVVEQSVEALNIKSSQVS